MREALSEEDLRNLAQARIIIGRWVEHYNEARLHAGISYLPPAEYYRGEPERRKAERLDKLMQGRRHRERVNSERLQRAA